MMIVPSIANSLAVHLPASAIVAIILFLVGHLGTAIWVASRMVAKVNELQSGLTSVKEGLDDLRTDVNRLDVLDSRLASIESDVRELRVETRDLPAVREALRRLDKMSGDVDNLWASLRKMRS